MTKKITFEDAFRRLEEIAQSLETGDVSLDESMKLYEEGMELIDFCGKKLDTAETTIRKLSKTTDGGLEAQTIDNISGD